MSEIKNGGQGFTLIELLVVVVIIGILAAIALPQYQVAVDKAQFSNFQNQVKSIKTAVDNYQLIHNEYPADFDLLDIDFSYEHINYVGEGCIVFEDSYCCVGKFISNYQGANIACGRNDYLFAYVYYDGVYSCVAKNGEDRAGRLCKSFNHRIKSSTKNLFTPYGHATNNGEKYTYYQLK